MMQLTPVSACPICFGKLAPLSISETHSLKALNRDVTFDFSICEACRFVCQSSVLPAEDLIRYYQESPKKLRDASPSATALTLYGTQARFMEHAGTVRGKRVLEIGADMGQFLDHLLREYGCETYYEEENRIAKMWLGEGDRHRDAGAAGAPRTFGWIVLSHVLEHIIDPVEALRGLRERLDGDGKLFIEVPHHGLWDDIDPGFFFEHLSYFSAASLTAALDRAGYHVLAVEVTTDPQYYAGRCRIIRACAQSRARGLIDDAAEVVRDHHRRQKEARFLKLDALCGEQAASGGAGVALYGAGDLAGLVMKHAATSGAKIAALFDSDARKHGTTFDQVCVQGPSEITQANPGLIVILAYAEMDVRKTIADAGYTGTVLGWSQL